PHRHIFTEMARLQESGSPIDLITLAESLERQGQLDSVTGVNTGYDDLNKKTAGLQPSDLIIVAARPSMGKTT
ncbi:DnaB-like helicase C-terminal domain-containing protein, partial [Escherichia coli]|nr:DnaB-like helicase C-terminal domain-containing protein [Escherichia coli]